jgi:alpha-1,3-rhamnosyltransferase
VIPKSTAPVSRRLLVARDWPVPRDGAGGLPVVTLIIPAYNHERYVRFAVESALSQEYDALEIIIIDDGSRDGTADRIVETLDAYAGKKRVRFYRQENQGLSRTLNFGLQLAEGAFVQFLASDDAYLTDKTATCVAALMASPAQVAAVYCDGFLMNDAGERTARFTDKYIPPISVSVYKELLIGNWIPALGMMYRTAVLRELQGFDESLAVEDYDLLLRVAERYDIRRLRARLFLYRWHENNFSRDAAKMAVQLALIRKKHSALRAYDSFQDAVRRRSLACILKHLSVFHVDIALRALMRRLQVRYKVQAATYPKLLGAVARRATDLASSRFRAMLSFAKLGAGSRLQGRIRITGNRANVTFGQRLRILGDIHITTTYSHVPDQIIVGDDSVLDCGVTLFSLGGDIRIGQNCFVGPGAMIQANGDVTIGDHSMIARNVSIFANNHQTRDTSRPFNTQGSRFLGISIGTNCWVAAAATILDGAAIGRNSVVGANCVVCGTHPEGAVIVAKAVIGHDVVRRAGSDAGAAHACTEAIAKSLG